MKKKSGKKSKKKSEKKSENLGGEILESAPHRMQESLKMFDFRARKRRSTYNLTVGRGKTLPKKTENS